MMDKFKAIGKFFIVNLISLFLLWSFYDAVQAQIEESWIIPETISSGLAHACGIRNNGTLTCWGRNDFGQVSPVPEGSFKQVSAGRFHTCAIRSDGTLTCWGDDLKNAVSDTPSGTFVLISASRDYTCAVGSNGIVTCWGYTYGQLLFQRNFLPMILK